jgi:FkbM family methyltransferase
MIAKLSPKMITQIKKLIKNSKTARILYSAVKNDIEEQKRLKFYKNLFDESSGLVFDVGSNLGNRTKVFADLGYNVIAVEPQKKCVKYLNKIFKDLQNVEIINCALGSQNETRLFYESKSSLLSTLSKDFIQSTSSSGRFDKKEWINQYEVNVITLKDLIKRKGVPFFLKIDVEGYEYEVINTLDQPLKLISLEFTPEMAAGIFSAINHILNLGPCYFNISWGESMKLSHNDWFDFNHLERIINSLKYDKQLFGDIYIKSEHG